MISPVWANVDYPITQPYNPAVHTGIDIGCPSGTVIYAARAGTVERVQTGMTSVHVSGSTQRDLYLHGTSVVFVGEAVAQGTPVIISDTVQVDPRYPLTGPHLHFEVQDGLTLPGAPPYSPGNPLDPVPVLQQTFGPGGGTIGGEDMRFVIGPIPPGIVLIVGPSVRHIGPLEWAYWQRHGFTADAVSQAELDEFMAAIPSGGGTEPAEPAEPKTITLHIPSVPGDATGTIS